MLSQLITYLRSLTDAQRAVELDSLSTILLQFNQGRRADENFVTLAPTLQLHVPPIRAPTPLLHPIPVRVVARVADVTEAFHWVESEKAVCLRIGDTVVKVPWPRVTNGSDPDSRRSSIQCRFVTRPRCDAASAARHMTAACSYAHQGEAYVKVGSQSKCDSAPSIGNPATFQADSRCLTDEDLRKLMLYGVTDLATASVILHQKKKPAAVICPSVCGGSSSSSSSSSSSTPSARHRP